MWVQLGLACCSVCGFSHMLIPAIWDLFPFLWKFADIERQQFSGLSIFLLPVSPSYIYSHFLLDKPGPPVIENEKSGVFNGDEGTNVTVKCTSDANPPAYYTWHKKMRDWTGKLDFHPIEKSGSYSGELTLYNASTNDTADYKCVASNQPNENDRAKQYSDQVLVKVIIRCKYCQNDSFLWLNSN